MKRYEQGSIGMRPDKEGAWCSWEDAQKAISNAARRAWKTATKERDAVWKAEIESHVSAAISNERERFARVCDALDEATDLTIAQDAMLRHMKAVIGLCRNTSMDWALKGRIPECGKFGEIAQDLDALMSDDKPHEHEDLK